MGLHRVRNRTTKPGKKREETTVIKYNKTTTGYSLQQYLPDSVAIGHRILINGAFRILATLSNVQKIKRRKL